MRNRLLATVAVAAVVGFGGFAAAQSQMGGESNKATSGATSGKTQEKSGEKSGGSMTGTQSGNKTLSPSSSQSSNPSRNQSAQEKSGKDNERLGQGRNEEQKEMTRGAQQEKSGAEQKGAQQERGLQKNQKGAQEQRGTNVKGAQEQRGTNMKGAEEQRGTTTERGATEEKGRAGVNVGERGERSGSVQLSEDQRSHIKTVIGNGRGPRLSRSNVDFSISVGTRVPRSVHFVTLPDEIVRIVPQYRGFEYFLVEDEIVIVDPLTLEIVAVIPA
ncbi:MAG: DUF1236 domain-containing protein [Xanthobacteraceae bacterium]|jgi:hypothetical protein